MPNTFTTSVNNFNANKFLVCVSNIPNLTEIPDDQLPLALLNNNLRGINLPDITLPNFEIHYVQEIQYCPKPIGPKELNSFTLEYAIDDRALNWWIFYSWIMKTRAGEAVRTDLDGDPLLRDNCIDSVRIYLYDNNKKVMSKIEFKRCFLTSISSLNLGYGDSEHKTFTLTFNYENIDFKLQDSLDSCDEDTLDDVKY